MSGLWLAVVALVAAGGARGAGFQDVPLLAPGVCPPGCEICVTEDVRRFYCGGQQYKYMEDRSGAFAELVCNDVPLNCSSVPAVGSRRGALQRLEVTSCVLPPLAPLSCAARGEGSEALTIRDGLSAPSPDNVRGLDSSELFLSFRPGVVTQFPSAAIAALPRLHSARILGGAGFHLQPDQFLPSPPPLSFLEISMSGLSELPPFAFRGLELLNTLSLWGNHIGNISEHALDGLVSLEKLVLNNNPLTSVAARALSRAPSLRTLYMERVDLAELTDGMLEGLPSLEQINLISNKNLTVGPRAFSDLPSLRSLQLTTSGVTSLPGDVFRGTTGIVNLTLSYNKIRVLPVEVFSSLPSLERLDVSGNEITAVTNDVFANLAQLVELNLDRNRIQQLPEYLFSGLGRLTSVSLAHNALSFISPLSFTGAGSLVRLSLSHNRLRWHEEGEFDESSPFNMLHNLQTLDLSHNEISLMYADWRIIISSLRSLDLSYNNFTQLSRADIQFLFSPVVDLTHNRITSIQGRGPFDEHTTSGVKLHLGYNPFRCDCNLYFFLQQLPSSGEFSVDQAACQSPRALRGQSLRRVRLLDVTCPLDDTPTGCDCLIRPLLDAAECSCNHTQVPSIAESGVRHMDLRLTSPPSTDLTHLPPYVTTLNLTNLNLTTIPSFPPTVQLLDISRNQIETISESEWNLYNTTTFSLMNNPLVCDCYTTDGVLLLQENYRYLYNYVNTSCSDGTLLKSKDANAMCDVFKSAFTGGLIAILLILLAVILALLYRYWVTIQVFLYSRGWCLSILPKESIDIDKKFDVFVSFAVEDEKFVREVILPKLEGEYILHVQDRDWVVGNTIPAEIHRSIEQSKRTLIILSSHFLKSIWASEEFRTTHIQATNDKRLRAVIVLLDVKKKELDKDTKTLLSLSTLLKFNEIMFWDKLRFALPRKEEVKGGGCGGELEQFWKGGGLDVVLNKEGKLINKGYVKDV